VRGENGECAGASTGGGEVVAPARSRMPSTQRRGPNAVGRARPTLARVGGGGRRGREEVRAGFAGWAGWLAPARQ